MQLVRLIIPQSASLTAPFDKGAIAQPRIALHK